MELISSQQAIKDTDAHCRLRHGLNVHCLALIFQYLNINELYEVGGMNEFYKQIISDLVIPKHYINCNILEESITIRQLFERYGAKIRQVRLTSNSDSVTQEFIDSITRNCSINRLKDVRFENCRKDDTILSQHFPRTTEFPIQLCHVERFDFSGTCQLNVPLSDSLRFLYLKYITFHENFNWAKLTNLTDIYLIFVNGFNEQNFIEFLRHQPKLKYFFHLPTLQESMQSPRIGELLLKYCGDHIQVLYDLITFEYVLHPDHYNFLSGLKNIKEVALSTHQVCGDNIINAIKRLSKNDSLEKLVINLLRRPYSTDAESYRNGHFCAFNNGTIYKKQIIKKFNHLKTIHIFTLFLPPRPKCYLMELFTIYSSEILSNVENIIIENLVIRKIKFIKYVPKLRKLTIYSGTLESKDAIELVSDLKKILLDRNVGEINGDFITLEISESCIEKFRKIENICKSIRITSITDFSQSLNHIIRSKYIN